MGVGSASGGGTRMFECKPGNCIVGYAGRASEHAVGRIGFIEGPIPDLERSQQSSASLLLSSPDACGVYSSGSKTDRGQ